MTAPLRTMPLREFLRRAEAAGCVSYWNGGDIVMAKSGVHYKLRLNGRRAEVGAVVITKARRHFGVDDSARGGKR